MRTLVETFPQPTVESSMMIFFSMHIIFGIVIPYVVTPCITFILKKTIRNAINCNAVNEMKLGNGGGE